MQSKTKYTPAISGGVLVGSGLPNVRSDPGSLELARESMGSSDTPGLDRSHPPPRPLLGLGGGEQFTKPWWALRNSFRDIQPGSLLFVSVI